MGPAGRLVTIKRSGVDGAHFPLSLRTCLFGRGIECDIRIQLPVVSKQHCKIEINQQEAILYNFSSINPTQVNGAAIDEPVPLKHGDVITIIDRSFRYENESHQNGSKATEFPGKICEQVMGNIIQEPARRASRTSFSADADDADWKDQDSRVHSKITEGNASGRPLVHVKKRTGDGPASRGSKDSIAPEPADTHSSEHPGRNGRNAEDPSSGDFKEKPRVTVSSYGELKSFPSPRSLDNSKKNESPFGKLYQSMKEELDVKSQNELQYRRKSGSQTNCTIEKESADGSQRETQLLASHKSRPKSGGSAHIKADPSSLEPEPSQPEEKGRDVEPVRASKEAARTSVPPSETAKMKSPVQHSQKHTDEDRSATDGRESVDLRQREGAKAADETLTPRKLLARNQTPTKGEDAAKPGRTPDSLSSRKRRSIPTHVEVLPTETQSKPFLTQCLAQAGKKILKDPLNQAETLGTTGGQICSGLPGLSSVDISNFGDSMNKSEDVPLKRRRVSFGGCLRPELFDENLPPNTPLKRGETPAKRKSLVAHTPAVLKKIIKEQPPTPGRESSSEIGLGVKAQNTCPGSPAPAPRAAPPGTRDQRRRSGKASAASAGGKSPHQTEVAKKAGRKSGHLSSKRASISRSQHGILQMICSKRRSGASEANLIVAKSWADVVKLGAKQTQTKVVKHGPQRQMNKRQRRASTPKKPMDNIHSQFSTGHANSPCTIIIGKAQIQKVNVPARPYRMLNNFVFNQKLDYSEDLSGLTEMFKTPAKERHQVTSMRSGTLSNSENLLGEKFHITNSGKKPLPITSEILGESVFCSTQNAAEEPSDKCSASPALRRKSIRERESMVRTPKNIYEMTRVEVRTPAPAAQPLKTVSSANKLRKSMELRKAQLLPAESKNETEANIPESVREKQARKTPLREKEEEREEKEYERSSETCKEDIQSEESCGKITAVRRSGRTGGQKYEPTADLADPKRTHKTEPTEDLSGSQALPQTPHRATETMNDEEKTTKTPCRSSQPEPLHPASVGKRRNKTPLGKVDVKEECALRKLTHSSGEASHTRGTPGGEDRCIKVFKGTPAQGVQPEVHVTGGERRPRTPKKKTQSLEDLTGFKELFQTPKGIGESLTDVKREMPCKSPQPAAVDTAATTKTPPHTPRRRAEGTQERLVLGKLRRMSGKAQPPEDLAGIQELFQTPARAHDPNTAEETAKTPCIPLHPETVRTPSASERRPRTRLEKVGVKEECSALRTPAQSPGRATRTPTGPVQEEKCIEASTETPRQTPDPTESVTGPKRRSKPPKEKAQPLEDLAGLQQLFQTPGHHRNPKTAGETPKTPCKSPQLGPADTPAASKRQPRMSLGKVDVKQERSTQSPGRATRTPTVPVQEEKHFKAFTETPKQTLDPTENVRDLKRRTPKEKAQPLEDLAGFQELFRTPMSARDPKTTDEIVKVPCKSPRPEPFRTPRSTKRQSRLSLGRADVKEEVSVLGKLTQMSGEAAHAHGAPGGGDNRMETFEESAEQTPEPAASVASSRRLQGAPREGQPLEDLAGLQELFQTPARANDAIVVEKTMKITCKSPGPVGTLTTPKRQPRMSLGKADRKKDPLDLRTQTQSPGRATPPPTVPVQEEKCIKASTDTPKQSLSPTGDVTGLKRRSRTPKGKAQPLEDLADLQQLFQTPGCGRNPKTAGETPKRPCQSPRPGPARTPASTKRLPRISLGKVDVKEEVSVLGKLTQTSGEATHTCSTLRSNGKGVEVFEEPAKQTLEPAASVTGSRRQSRASKEKAQPLEDLAGIQELFQTPARAQDPNTAEETAKMPCIPLHPETVRTPSASERRPRTRLEKVSVKEECSALRTPAQSPGRAMRTPTGPVQEEKCIEASTETPRQTRDPTESVTRPKRRSKPPKEKAQPLEDLAGLQQLFQTPAHAKDPKTAGETPKTPCRSPQSGPQSRPQSGAASKRQPRMSLGKVDVKQERSAQSPGRATRTPTVPVQEEKRTEASTETPKQTADPTESVTGPKRRSKPPKEKAQPLEDLAGLQQLFQTPGNARNPKTAGETPKTPCRSPQPGPADTPAASKRQPRMSLGKVDVKQERSGQSPGRATRTPTVPVQEEKRTEASTETPRQTLDPTESVTGPKRRSKPPKEKAQPLEDLAGLQQLFQTPARAKDPKTAGETPKTPCKSPQPGPADTPAASKRQPRMSLGKVDVKEERSTVRKQMQTLGESALMHQESTGDDKSIEVLKKPAKRKLDPAENVTGRKRPRGAPKGKAQLLEDLAGLQELFQTPDHTKESRGEGQNTKMPRKSLEPVATPPASKRQPRTRLRKADVTEELSAQGTVTGTSGETVNAKEPEGDSKTAKVSKDSAKRKLDPAASVAGSKRLRGAPRGKAQPLEDLAGPQEPIQTPGHSEESRSGRENTKVPGRSPHPEPAGSPASTKTGPRTRLRKVGVQEEPAAVRKPTRTTRATRHTPKVPEGGDGSLEAVAESAKQTLDPAVGATGSRRLRGARRGKAQPLEDLAGPQEPIQAPGHSEGLRSDGKNTEIPCKSPQPEPVATRPTSKRQPRTRLRKADVIEELSTQGTVTGTSRETTNTKEPQVDSKNLKVSKDSAKRKLDPAASVAGSKRLRGAPREEAQPLEDLAGPQEPIQTPGHSEESRSGRENTKVPGRSPHPEPAGSPASTKTGPRTRLRKVGVQEEPAAMRKPTRTTRATRHTPKVPEGGDGSLEAVVESAKQTLDPAVGATGSRRLRGARRGKAQPLEDLAGPQEPIQAPGHSEGLGSDAHSLKSSPKQTPDRVRPLTSSRRVLRAPKGKPAEDLVDRDPATSQSTSDASLPPKAESGKDRSVPGTRGLRSVTPLQEVAQGKPARRTQRAAPRARSKSPEHLKKDLRIFINRIEPVKEQESNIKTEKKEQEAEDPVTSNKGISLRSRHQNKSDGEQKKPEFTVSAENIKIKRNEKKPMKTSPEMELWKPDDGAKEPTSRREVRENSTRLRPGRQTKLFQPPAAGEKVRGKGVEIPTQNPQEKAGNPDLGLRSRRTGTQPRGSTLERESEKRVTRGAKRCAENPKKDKDIAYTKEKRSRSRRGNEDI